MMKPMMHYNQSSQMYRPPVLTSEIQNTNHQLKRYKAAGQDNVTSDLLKDSGDIIHSKLAHLFTECLKQGEIPDDWNSASVILSRIKGDQKDLSNCRPISLLNIIYKQFTKVITNKFAKLLDTTTKRTGRL